MGRRKVPSPFGIDGTRQGRAEIVQLRANFFRVGLRFFAALQAGVTAGKLALEFLDATFRVDELLLARIERMTGATDIDLQLRTRAAGRKRASTTALNRRFEIFRMNVFLHRSCLRPACEGFNLSFYLSTR